MKELTHDETNLICIYNTGNRSDVLDRLRDMKQYLEPGETELLQMTDSAIRKLEEMTDEEFLQLDLVPDFSE